MIKDCKFWEAEAQAPLLRRNANFINRKNSEELIARAECWVDLAQSKASASENGDFREYPEIRSTCDDPACQRIFELDAERTFSNQENREHMVTILCTIHQELNDYHQGVAFLVAFAMLFLSDEQVVKLVVLIHRHYVPGYFKSAPEAYVRDAKVLERLLYRFYPAISKRLSSMAPAEAFASKWWIGMCVHVLPFQALMDFFDGLLEHGHLFLFQFALALVKNCEEDLLDPQRDVSKVLATLRFDASDYPDTKATSGSVLPGSFFTGIIDDAITQMRTQLEAVDLTKLREDADDEMAQAAERRRQIEAKFDSEDEIRFSDED